jgi:pimeloyl-ACP methyl ester carboxylesterase
MALSLSYKRKGSGPALIILHGFLGMGDNWITMSSRLAEEFDVIVPDLRNHGNSPHSADFSFEAMAGDLLQLTGDLNINSCSILGHSMGGKLAMYYALKFPERMSKLIVADISPFTLPEDPSHRILLNTMAAFDFTDVKNLREAETLLSAKIPDSRAVQMCMKNIKKALDGSLHWKLNVPVLLEKMDNVKQVIKSDNPFNKPALFVKGALSPYFINEEWDDILKIFPQAGFTEIPQSGHWLHVDQPEVFYNVCRSFLL